MNAEKQRSTVPIRIADEQTANAVSDMPRLQSALRNYCLALADTVWDAEDLAQDAWLRALQSPALGAHPNPEAYLLRIAKNAWIDRSRRNARLFRILKAERPAPVLPEEDAPDIEAIFHALSQRLPPLQRAVFLSRDVLGYSSSETAKLLRTTEGAVKAALHRARGNLLRVREDLLNDAWPTPEQADLKAYLKMIAAAYKAGDTTSMLALVQLIEAEPAAAIGLLHSRQLQASRHSSHLSRGKHGAASPVLLLAAS